MTPRRALPVGLLAVGLALVRCGSSTVAPSSVGPPAGDGGTAADAGSGADAGEASDAGPEVDGGRADAGPGTDGGGGHDADGGSADAGSGGTDGGPTDGGPPDGGASDGGAPDAGPAPGSFRLTVQLPGPGSGRVESQPPGIACPGTCSADFPAGQITLTETPAQGSALAYWAGACGGSSATCSVRLGASVAGTQDFLVVADFEPPPPLTYSVREIPKSYTAYRLNAAANAAGVGYGGAHSGDGDAFLFDAATGKTTFLFFSTPESSHAQDINGRNAMVANAITSRTGDTRTRTVRWEAGVATDLGTIGGNTWGYGINDSNQVVGWFVKTDGPRSYTRAFFHDGQRMLDLGSLDGTCSEARSINASGVAVGSSCIGTTQHAVIFRRGAAPEDLAPDSPGIADVISDAGWIAGRSGADGFIRSPGGQLRSAGRLPGGSGSWLHGVNDSGVAVGVAYVPAYNPKGFLDIAFRAVAFVDGRLWDLGYLTGSPDLLLLEAFGVNASGQIVATGFRPGADGSSFLLTPR